MRPTFLIIGAAKSGTTSLYALLGNHPDVGMSNMKEPQFFSDDNRYEKGWSWYESLFADCQGKTAIGEASVQYSWVGIHPKAPERIARDIPNVRVIYIVRHPLARIQSMWTQYEHAGLADTQSFNKAVRKHPQLIDSSFYWRQVSAYRKHLPDEQMQILFFEDLRADADALLARCFQFIGVDPAVQLSETDRPRNAAADHSKDHQLLTAMRKAPMFDTVRDALPTQVRSGLRKVLKKPIEGLPTWDDETKEWAIDQLADDTKTFLEFCGKPTDYWDLHVTP